MRELRREEIAPTRPERCSVLVPSSQTAVPVKLNFIKPLFAFGGVLDGEGIHWLNELDGSDVSSSCFHLKDRRRSERERNQPLKRLLIGMHFSRSHVR
jgi:hypothetical protein